MYGGKGCDIFAKTGFSQMDWLACRVRTLAASPCLGALSRILGRQVLLQVLLHLVLGVELLVTDGAGVAEPVVVPAWGEEREEG
jgi:hypothetical protein